MSPRVRPNNYGFRGKMCRGHNTAIFTMLYPILLTLWFHKTFKLIFLNQSSWPKTMYAEHWRKLAWATFLGNFPVLLVQHICGTLINSCLLEYATVSPIKKKFSGFFDLLFWFSSRCLVLLFCFLKWNSFWNCLGRNVL